MDSTTSPTAATSTTARGTRARKVAPDTPSRSYWIGVTSRDHVALARAGGFIQINHGKAGPLERMRVGDGFAYYSPREAYPDGAVLQALTALGIVTGEAIRQADMGGGFQPFRRDVRFLDTHDAPIKPLIDALTFIRSKQHWGAAFRFGVVRVPREDFALIATAMGRDVAMDFPTVQQEGLAPSASS